jgi:hypothetical protein
MIYQVTIYDVRDESEVLSITCPTIEDACDTRDLLLNSKLFSIPTGGIVTRIK